MVDNVYPNIESSFSPSKGIDFFAIGLQITGIASLVGAINPSVTVLNMRSPGMTLMKMPVLTWMLFIVRLLLLFAMPVISVALFLLTFDLLFDANFSTWHKALIHYSGSTCSGFSATQRFIFLFFQASVLFQRSFQHSVGNQYLDGSFMIFSGIAIGFMGWGVWAHHMFASGIGPVAVAVLSFNNVYRRPDWCKDIKLACNYVGWTNIALQPQCCMRHQSWLCSPSVFRGSLHSPAAADTQQTDTYYIVAHFHYALFRRDYS